MYNTKGFHFSHFTTGAFSRVMFNDITITVCS